MRLCLVIRILRLSLEFFQDDALQATGILRQASRMTPCLATRISRQTLNVYDRSSTMMPCLATRTFATISGFSSGWCPVQQVLHDDTLSSHQIFTWGPLGVGWCPVKPSEFWNSLKRFHDDALYNRLSIMMPCTTGFPWWCPVKPTEFNDRSSTMKPCLATRNLRHTLEDGH